MRFGMILRWWWARLSGRATAPRQVLESIALILEKMHINRQLLRAPLAEMPVSGAERLWWRERFGRPDGYASSDGKRSDVRSHLIERHWENRWWSLSPRGADGSLGGVGASRARRENVSRHLPGRCRMWGDGARGDVESESEDQVVPR